MLPMLPMFSSSREKVEKMERTILDIGLTKPKSNIGNIGHTG
jgi:hypothetical protein